MSRAGVRRFVGNRRPVGIIQRHGNGVTVNQSVRRPDDFVGIQVGDGTQIHLPPMIRVGVIGAPERCRVPVIGVARGITCLLAIRRRGLIRGEIDAKPINRRAQRNVIHVAAILAGAVGAIKTEIQPVHCLARQRSQIHRHIIPSIQRQMRTLSRRIDPEAILILEAAAAQRRAIGEDDIECDIGTVRPSRTLRVNPIRKMHPGGNCYALAAHIESLQVSVRRSALGISGIHDFTGTALAGFAAHTELWNRRPTVSGDIQDASRRRNGIHRIRRGQDRFTRFQTGAPKIILCERRGHAIHVGRRCLQQI